MTSRFSSITGYLPSELHFCQLDKNLSHLRRNLNGGIASIRWACPHVSRVLPWLMIITNREGTAHCGQYHPPGQGSCIKLQAQHAMRSKPASSLMVFALHGLHGLCSDFFPLVSYLSSCLTFPQWWTTRYKSNEPLHAGYFRSVFFHKLICQPMPSPGMQTNTPSKCLHLVFKPSPSNCLSHQDFY